MKQKDIERLMWLGTYADINGYGEDERQRGTVKQEFLGLCTTYLKGLGKKLGPWVGKGKVHANWGGPAVSGEVTLMTPQLYVQLEQFNWGAMASAGFYRAVRNNEDYTGGSNHNLHHWLMLQDMDALVATMLDATRYERERMGHYVHDNEPSLTPVF